MDYAGHEELARDLRTKHSNSPFASLCALPPAADNVKLESVPHEFSTAEVNIPEGLADPSALPPHLRDCLELFLANWTKVSISQSEEGRGHLYSPPEGASDMQSLPPLVYELDSPAQPSEQPFPLVNDLTVTTMSDSVKHKSEQSRASLHQPFLRVFPATRTDFPLIDHRRPSATSPFESKYPLRIRVDVSELKFEHTSAEQDLLFCSMALYELPASHKEPRLRLTETFHFDLNTPVMLAHAVNRPGPIDPVTTSRAAIFNLNQPPSANIWLVLRVHRLLVGELDSGTAPYVKPLKAKEAGKFNALVLEAARRLGQYTQPFAIAAVQLFPDGTPQSLLSSLVIAELVRAKGDLSDAHLFDKFQSFRREKSLVAGHLTLRTSLLGPKECPQHCINPSLLLLKAVEPSASSSSSSALPSSSAAPGVVRSILAFPRPLMNLQPHIEFQHLLYLYPESINMNKYSGKLSARNLSVDIRVLADDSQVPDTGSHAGIGECILFGRSNSARLVGSAVTSVQYHVSKPDFDDEVKIALPALPLAKAHLLFIFKHIQCRPPSKKEKDKPAEGIVGFAWLPLTVAGGFLPSQEWDLPVAYHLEPGYLSPAVATSLRYVDKSRPIFAVRTNLVSSIHSDDPVLKTFFVTYDNKANPDAELRKAIENLPNASSSELSHFFPVLFGQLLQLIYTSSEIISRACFDAIGRILQSVESNVPAPRTDANRFPLFESFVTHHFAPPPIVEGKRLFHEVFVETWLHFITYSLPSTTTTQPLSSLPWITYTWLFFELLFKSLVGQLDFARGNFPRPFFATLSNLLDKIRSISAPLILTLDPVGEQLNTTVALFLKDLMSLGNGAPVFEVIARYVEHIDASSSGTLCTQAKFDIFSSLFSHQWLLPLSLPPADSNLTEYLNSIIDADVSTSNLSSAAPSAAASSSSSLAIQQPNGPNKRHVLHSLFIQHAVKILVATKDAATQNARSKALRTFQSIVQHHACDPRFQQKEYQERIALLYVPFIWLLLDNESVPEGRVVSLATERWAKHDSEILFSIIYWIIRTTPLQLWRSWFKKISESRRMFFFTILANTLETFEHEASEHSAVGFERKDSTQDQVLKMASMVDPISMALNRQSSKNAYETISRSWLQRRRGTSSSPSLPQTSVSTSSAGSSTPPRQLSEVSLRSQYRGVEIAVLFLDLIHAYINDFAASLREAGNTAFGRLVVTSVLLILKKNHPTIVLTAVFHTIQELLLMFPESFFLHPNTPHCGDVVYELIRHCNFQDVGTRSQATSVLLAFFLVNFRTTGNITKMKLSCSVAIAKLVLQGVERNTTNLRCALKIVADSVASQAPPNAQAMVKDAQQLLNSRLISALHHHQLLLEHQHDVELVHDLIYQISLGFQDSPDIRFTWLDGLAKKLASGGHLEEAAQCKIHLAALISAYLQVLKPHEAVTLPLDCLRRASPNSLVELQVPETAKASEGICSTAHFTRPGLFTEFAEALSYLNDSQLYESAIEVQRILTEIHKKNREFQNLSRVLGELADLCDKIQESNETNARLFSNFYLVGFYGTAFKGLNGRQFVYKENGAVRLGDIMTRLPAQWAQKFGKEKVKYIPFSAKFDASALDPEILHIQISSVEPFFDDMSLRLTPFECKSNVSRFIIENPICRDGGNRDNPEDNGKLKTIIDTSNPFPFVLKRIPVIKTQQITLSPLEASIELLQDRTMKLRLECEAVKPNAKTLQIVLQGSVAPTVNAGPKAIIRTFLENASAHPPDKILLLKQTAVELLQMCQRALQVNQGIIDPSQKPFHAMLVEGYMTLSKETAAFLSASQDGGDLSLSSSSPASSSSSSPSLTVSQ